jgi:peroxiredoxin
LRGFQQRLSDFTARGVTVAAISVDSKEINQNHCRKMGFTFPILSDTNADVIRLYDVLHRGAGPNRTDIARPAEFYVSRAGTVQWVNLTGNIAVRLRPEQVLSAIDAASGSQ